MNYKELINFYFKFKSIVDLLFAKDYIGFLLYELQNRMKLNFNITTIHFYNLPHSYDINTLKKHFITMQKLNEKGKRNNPSKENFVKVNKNKNSFFEGLIIVNKKFKGKAKIIKKTTRKEINNTEVMVSEITNVDYIPAMIKSKAIITEFGNYTSHAAIVARELNKPCIVGVRGITSYCKDGDLIKFDGRRIFVFKK
jgi:phosphohistidine swiveling domain-containing protein